MSIIMSTHIPLTSEDFSIADLVAIRELCCADTQGEETWHGFTLANGRELDIDCFDESLVTDCDSRGYLITAYVVNEANPYYVSYFIGLIPYSDMLAL